MKLCRIVDILNTLPAGVPVLTKVVGGKGAGRISPVVAIDPDSDYLIKAGDNEDRALTDNAFVYGLRVYSRSLEAKVRLPSNLFGYLSVIGINILVGDSSIDPSVILLVKEIKKEK